MKLQQGLWLRADEERQAGLTFPGIYALMAQAYMQNIKFLKILASISVKTTIMDH